MTTERRWPSVVLDLRGQGEGLTPDLLQERLNKAAGSGEKDARGVLVSADGSLLSQLRKCRRRGIAFDVFAVIPNMTLYVRQVSQLGAPRAGLHILRYASPSVLWRTGWLALQEVRPVLANDFCAAMRILFEFELNQLRSLKPSCVFLHPQITDLALAFRNPQVLSDFQARVALLSMDVTAGFGTNNLGLLQSRVGEWKFSGAPVLTPFNPNGFLMKPNRAQCETFAGDPSAWIMADRTRVDPGTQEEACRYLRAFAGIKATVIEG